jgi:hypothetical protein
MRNFIRIYSAANRLKDIQVDWYLNKANDRIDEPVRTNYACADIINGNEDDNCICCCVFMGGCL